MPRVRYPIAGKTVLITGPARGIGAETARQLAAGGARLGLAGLEPERLEELAAELPEAAWFETDVRDAAALERAAAGTVERFGGIDVVIANAGVPPPVTTVEHVDPAAFERVIEINLLGVWRTVRAALPHVLERRGYVLTIASLAAAIHSPLMAPYAAAKAGVEGFANSLRVEVEPAGVAVGVAYFGVIDTDMVRDSYAEAGAQQLLDGAPRWITRRLPASSAARGLVRGIERRARRVVVPGTMKPLVLAPGIFQPLADAMTRRAGLAEALRAVETQAPSTNDR
jgi:NAD(P)-dependent dehydrogenase (short-subunit alcohol dehydrogenase family)